MKKYYWINALPISQDELDLSANQIVSLANSSYFNREAYKQLRKSILDLSMYCLADVRGNYFWPEFHREVSKRVPENARMPAEAELTKFCRDVLRNTDEAGLSDLQDNDVHNRFIALIFEQAGIGKDRNRIIKQFLAWIVNFRSSIAPDGSGSGIDIPIRKYIATLPENERRDVGLLENVLSGIARELLSLVDAAERHPDRLDMIEWSWSEMCHWWMEKTGNDLNQLTPSAASVLMEWISRLSCVWTRSDLFRLSRMGSISCIWPDGRTCSSFRHHSELPLGRALLQRGSEDENIMVVDSKYTTSASDLMDSSGRRREGLNFFHKFKWRSGKLYISIGNIHTSMEDGEEYTFALGGKKVWQGEIKSGMCVGRRGFFLDISQLGFVSGNRINAELFRNEELSQSRNIEVWPLNHDSFLVSSGHICRPSEAILKHMSPEAESIGISLVTACMDSEIILTNVSEMSRNESTFRNRRFAEIRLGGNSHGSASVKAGKLKWNIDFRTIPDFSYPPDTELSFNGISFTGSGNIRVAAESSDIIIKCPDMFHDQIFDGSFGLWMMFDGTECFARIERNSVVHDGSGLAVNLSVMAKNSGINLSTGLFEVIPGTPDCRFAKSFRFFIASDSAEIKVSPIDGFSSVCIRISNDIRTISSAEKISLPDIESARFCHGGITGPDWQVGLRWKPAIFDVLVNGLSGRHSNYIYPLLSIDGRARPEELFITPYFPEACVGTLRVNGRSFTAVSGIKSDFYQEVIAGLGSGRDPGVVLTLECQNQRVSWTIDFAPVVRNLSVENVFRTGGVLLVALDLDIVSLFPTEIKIELRDACRGTNALSARTAPDALRISSEALRYVFSLEANGPEDHEVFVYHCEKGKLIHSELLKIAVEENHANDSRNHRENIKNLINSYRENGSSRILEEIFFCYLGLAAAEGVRVNSRSLSARMASGLNPEAETASMLALKLVDISVSGSAELVRLPELEGLPRSIASQLAAMWLILSHRYSCNGVLVTAEFNYALDAVRSACAQCAENDRIYAISCLTYRYVAAVMTDFNIENMPDPGRIDFDSDVAVNLRRICSDFDSHVRNLNV
jgi:hypothetical protein